MLPYPTRDEFEQLQAELELCHCRLQTANATIAKFPVETTTKHDLLASFRVAQQKATGTGQSTDAFRYLEQAVSTYLGRNCCVCGKPSTRDQDELCDACRDAGPPPKKK